MQPIISLITLPFRLLLWIPLSVLSAPRRLLGMSLAMRVAVVTAVFLVVGTLVVVIIRWLWLPEAAGTWHFLSPWWLWFLLVPALWAIIPITLYYAVKLWLEGDVSNFPDIDLAWNHGINALAQSGLSVNDLPVFLILGVGDDRQLRSMMSAANLGYRVKGVPEGPAALHWYASDSAIFLACTQVSRSSKLASLGARQKPPVDSPDDGRTRHEPLGGGTMVVGGGTRTQFNEPDDLPVAHVASATMVFSNTGGDAGGSMGGPASPSNVIKLSKDQEQEATARLEHLSHLLWRARQPVCPANGALTLLPFGLLQRAAEGFQLRDAVRADMATLRRKLKLRCPTVALVTGMEAEPGFMELIKRVGPEKATAQRFGKSFNVHNKPTSEQLNAVGTHACGAFEDFVYKEFSKPEALRQVGNRKLYAMLYKIRGEIQPRLTHLLDSAFADDAEEGDAPEEEAMLFGGCYFAATADSESGRAFVKSVLDKLAELENDVEWTQEALEENDRYHFYAQIGLLVDGVLLLSAVGLLLFAWWYRSSAGT